MTDAPASKIIVDFDKPGSPLPTSKTRCDYLLVAEDENARGWVLVLELKKGELNANTIVRQLQAGASAAEKLVPRGEAVRLRFRPIAVSGNAHKHQRTKLKKKANRIKFHGRKKAVQSMSCNASLFGELRHEHGQIR